jgi:hypothetical protein
VNPWRGDSHFFQGLTQIVYPAGHAGGAAIRLANSWPGEEKSYEERNEIDFLRSSLFI